MAWTSDEDFLADLDELSDFSIVKNSQPPEWANPVIKPKFKLRNEKKKKYYEGNSNQQVGINSNGRLSIPGFSLTDENSNDDDHLQILNEISFQVNMVFGNLYQNKNIEDTIQDDSPKKSEAESLVFCKRYDFLSTLQNTKSVKEATNLTLDQTDSSVLKDSTATSFRLFTPRNKFDDSTNYDKNYFSTSNTLASNFTEPLYSDIYVEYNNNKNSRNYCAVSSSPVNKNAIEEINIYSKEEFPPL